MSLKFAPSRFDIVRGTTWNDVFQLVDDLAQPISLVGIAGLTMRVREENNSTAVLLEASTANGRLTVTNAASGIVAITVSAADTLALPINDHYRASYVYDAVVDRGGVPRVIEPCLKGKLKVDPQVTRLLAEP